MTDLIPIDLQELTSATQPLDQHPAAVYLASLAPGSRRTMRTSLETVARLLGYADMLSCPWWELRYQHTAALRSALMQRYQPATANKILAAMRRVLLESRRLGLMHADDYARAADVQHIQASTLPRGRALSSGELGALIGACLTDTSPAGARDAAIIAILGRAGLRRAEAAALQLGDYDDGALTVRGGKGRKDRMTYVDGGSMEAIEEWIAVRGDTAGALLCPVDKMGRIKHRGMSDQALMYILQRRAKQAMVAPFTPHDLRRTFISDLLDAGADIATVQRLAGHADPATTSKYDRRGEQTKRKAASLLHLPYVRSTKL